MESKKISKGQIIQFSKDKGFGFIRKEDDGEEIFFHINSVIGKSVEVNNYVTFLCIPSKKRQDKLEAFNVTRAYLSKDNYLVVNRPASHLHDDLETHLSDFISLIECKNREFITEQIDFGYPVGYTNCVEISDTDEIFYAVRNGRKGFSKFVNNRNPELTNSITIVLKKTFDFYTIITAYCGKLSGVEPWDERSTETSIRFWATHALRNGTEKFDSNTITTICPKEYVIPNNLKISV